jgi:nitroreductase
VPVLRDLIEMATLDIDEAFKEILEYRKHPEALDCDATAFERIVESRRSIRVFDRAVRVPEDVINKCLDLAMLAPNSSNLQPWEFYWVRSPDKRQELVRWCMSQPPARTASDLIVLVARPDVWRRNCDALISKLQASQAVPESALDYYRLACPMMYAQAWGVFSIAKHLIFNLQGIFKPIPREPNFQWGMQMWASKSVCLAASILMLAISAYGYDSCPMEGFDGVRVKKLLKLPRNARVIMIIALGKRENRGVYGERVRLDRSWCVQEV